MHQINVNELVVDVHRKDIKNLHLGVYLLAFLIRTMHLWNITSFRRAPVTLNLFLILMVIGAVFAGGIVSQVLLWKNGLRINQSVITIVLIWVHLIGRRYPESIQALHEESRKIRYERSHIANLDVDRILAELNRLMEAEKVYADEDLNLRKLAEDLNITAHQLSEVLNTRVGKSYHDFIHDVRIEAAKHMLLEDPDRTILSVGLAVGFNSKSAFYSAFEKRTGTTPGDFRKNPHGEFRKSPPGQCRKSPPG